MLLFVRIQPLLNGFSTRDGGYVVQVCLIEGDVRREAVVVVESNYAEPRKLAVQLTMRHGFNGPPVR
jgi:hypothetical protein